jgi:UDP-N-acetylglucosamine 2-epimerase
MGLIGASNPQLCFLESFGLLNFITLEKNAHCILSDSGTVQEESVLFGVPNGAPRVVTERRSWSVPKEYLEETVCRIVLGSKYI